jgi:predicted ATP-grasp superfamily ATP-dependent carboligase
MFPLDTSTPVLVLMPVHHVGLGIVRSLGRLGVPVYFATERPNVPALLSRFCSGYICCNVHEDPPGTVVAALLSLGANLGRRAILLPTSDQSARFVAAHAATLGKCFLFPQQTLRLIDSLTDKSLMHRAAAAFGIESPATVSPRTPRELLEYLDRAIFPVVLKPELTEAGVPDEKRLANDVRTVLDHFDRSPSNRIMIQEYIPGRSDRIWMFNGYFDADSNCLAGYTGQKLRQYKPDAGVTSLGVCARNDEVFNLSVRFMQALGYRGVVDIEYCFDERDGRYKVLDVNPRIGATFRLFVGEEGMDVVRALYLDITGQHVPQDRERQGRKWIVEDFDLLASLAYIRHGALGVWSWINGFRGLEEGAFFAWDDWRPFLHMVGFRGAGAYHRIQNRLNWRHAA